MLLELYFHNISCYFMATTRNSMLYGRKSGLYSAVIISNSIVLFSIIKYLGAVYLIIQGEKHLPQNSYRYKVKLSLPSTFKILKLLKQAFYQMFLTKYHIFFLSIFTTIFQANTPLWLQFIYGFIISLAHFVCCFLHY